MYVIDYPMRIHLNYLSLVRFHSTIQTKSYIWLGFIIGVYFSLGPTLGGLLFRECITERLGTWSALIGEGAF